MAKRVLVVDDNPDVAMSFAMLLDAMGHKVHTASDGASALQLASQFQPQIVFLDIGLPVMNGYEVARRLRQLLADTPLTIVALTGSEEWLDADAGDPACFDHYLVKPASIEQLEKLLES